MLDLQEKIRNARRLKITFTLTGLVFVIVGIWLLISSSESPPPIRTETGFFFLLLGIVNFFESRRFSRELKTDVYLMKLADQLQEENASPPAQVNHFDSNP